MKKDVRFDRLLSKYNSGEASQEEKAILENWYNAVASEKGDEVVEGEMDRAKQAIWNGIDLVKPEFAETEVEIARPVYRLWYKMVAAVSVVVVVSAGIYFYSNRGLVGNGTGVAVVKSDIAPAVDGGTLTLSDGRVVAIASVAKGTMVEQPGVSVSRLADGSLVYRLKETGDGRLKYNTLATSNGEKVQVNLQDGTKVWLNAASSLRYPTSFASLRERRVELSGEGYFEVAKDRSRPFHVGAAGQDVAVLGTHFNISAYGDEPFVRTTLLEGSVKLDGKLLLKPGELALNRSGELKVGAADVDREMAWKNGDFVFRGETLQGLMKEISRWYDVQVVFEKDAPMEVQLEGIVSRSRNLSEVLERMSQTGSVHFKLVGKTLRVMK